MEEADLAVYIEKYGDRIATKDFCRRSGNINSRESLIEKLRRKIHEKNSKRKGKAGNHDTAVPSTSGTSKKSKKETRLIYLGWIQNGHYVRGAKGGGSRRISVPKAYKKADLIKTAIDLFFPNNRNAEELKECTLLDFKNHEFDDDLTVEEIFNITKISEMRFYLSTKNSTDLEKECGPEHSNRSKRLHLGTEESSRTAAIAVPASGDHTNQESGETGRETDTFNINEFINLYDEDEDSLPVVFQNINEVETFSEPTHVKLTLHRGHVFMELLEYFKTAEVSNVIVDVEMVLPNGRKEAAFDGGGVFRDALCEFWTHFYNSSCTGNTSKVPTIRHDFGETTWMSIAKVLFIGFKQARYLPTKLSRAFMEETLFGAVFCDITESFLKYLGPCDSKTVREALNDPKNANLDDLNDIMETMQCRTILKTENITDVVREIAHAETIQKPKYIIDIWNNVLKNKISYEECSSIYDKSTASSKSILNLLEKPKEGLTTQQEKVFSFLKRYIREVETPVLENFLRFCTGSDIITTNAIQVIFNTAEGIARTPIAHTCTCLLELSVSYETYNEFRFELNSVLSSNIWVMDII